MSNSGPRGSARLPPAQTHTTAPHRPVEIAPRWAVLPPIKPTEPNAGYRISPKTQLLFPINDAAGNPTKDVAVIVSGQFLVIGTNSCVTAFGAK